MESGKTPETPKPGSSGQTGMAGGPTPKRIDAPTAVSADTASLTDTAKQAASQVASKASEWTDQASTPLVTPSPVYVIAQRNSSADRRAAVPTF